MNGFDHPERNPYRDRGSTFSSHLFYEKVIKVKADVAAILEIIPPFVFSILLVQSSR